ncbi:MAG: hypothetical protein M0Q24_04395 [Sulfurimonas sp.]|uniref:PP0621 family protein n=1 Tax=Sulfurimonas sp. TaxID=2022749 RepID=UPI0025D46AFC|nr:PP0621 family protein [Sulfurimonas sp.]MCK9491307.1 hypothetical protein [Sulfurimonas sp.]
MQWILVIVLIAVVYFVFIKKKPQVKHNKKDSLANDMVSCEQCGIYCEVDDTIISNNKYYCSQECLKRS